MLGSSEANIDSILVFDECSAFRSDHRYKDKVELTTLRAIYRQNVVIHFVLGEVFRYEISLRVIRCYNIDALISELHERSVVFLVALLRRFIKLIETEIFERDNDINFLLVQVRGAFECLLAGGHIDEQKWGGREHKLLL